MTEHAELWLAVMCGFAMGVGATFLGTLWPRTPKPQDHPDTEKARKLGITVDWAAREVSVMYRKLGGSRGPAFLSLTDALCDLHSQVTHATKQHEETKDTLNRVRKALGDEEAKDA